MDCRGGKDICARNHIVQRTVAIRHRRYSANREPLSAQHHHSRPYSEFHQRIRRGADGVQCRSSNIIHMRETRMCRVQLYRSPGICRRPFARTPPVAHRVCHPAAFHRGIRRGSRQSPSGRKLRLSGKTCGKPLPRPSGNYYGTSRSVRPMARNYRQTRRPEKDTPPVQRQKDHRYSPLAQQPVTPTPTDRL